LPGRITGPLSSPVPHRQKDRKTLCFHVKNLCGPKNPFPLPVHGMGRLPDSSRGPCARYLTILLSNPIFFVFAFCRYFHPEWLRPPVMGTRGHAPTNGPPATFHNGSMVGPNTFPTKPTVMATGPPCLSAHHFVFFMSQLILLSGGFRPAICGPIPSSHLIPF